VSEARGGLQRHSSGSVRQFRHGSHGDSVSEGTETCQVALSNLVDAMSGLLRALNALAGKGVLGEGVPEELPEELARLAARLHAVRGRID
jgi:hypothetical protein